MKISSIGVGNMGGAVARRVAASSDFAVTVFDPSPAAVQKCVDAGATASDSLPAAVAGADVVLTSLPTVPLVLDTIRQILPETDENTVIVDISTIDPQSARTVLDLCTDSSRPFVACPLGKTPAHAETGQIPLFVGGEPDVVARIGPLLDWMGEKTYNFGTVEAATAFKLVSNFIGMANVAILAEGLAVALKAGISPEAFTEALADTGARSFQSDLRLPWMLEQDWTSRFGVDLAVKDVGLAVASALSWRIPVPVGSAALAQLTAASTRGYGREDVVSMLKLVRPDAAEGPR